MERDDKKTINRLVCSLSLIWLAGASLGAFRLDFAIYQKFPILGVLMGGVCIMAVFRTLCDVFDKTSDKSGETAMKQNNDETRGERNFAFVLRFMVATVVTVALFSTIDAFASGSLSGGEKVVNILIMLIGAAIAIPAFKDKPHKNDEPEETNQDAKSENGASLSVTNAVKPIVKAVVKAKAVAPYQTKMCGLAKQFEDYDAELRNLGKETGNYKKAMEIIKKEFNRQCDYVARIAEIEGKQGDMSGNEKTVEISKKVRKSYKAHRDEATKSIESLIGNAEQVVVLMQRDLQNQIFDAHAQVETGKINDMISKLEGSVQLDKEINAEAAESCMELKGIEQPSKE